MHLKGSLKRIALITAVLLFSSTVGPGVSYAMQVPSEQPFTSNVQRDAAVDRVMAAVEENAAVEARLRLAGIDKAALKTQLQQLDDRRLLETADQVTLLRAGGDAAGAIAGVLIVAILVVLFVWVVDRASDDL